MGWRGCWTWACGQRQGGGGDTSVPPLPRDKVPQGPDSLSSTGPDHSCHVVYPGPATVAWHFGYPGTASPGRADREVVAGGPAQDGHPGWGQGSCSGKWGGSGAVSTWTPRTHSCCRGCLSLKCWGSLSLAGPNLSVEPPGRPPPEGVNT